MTDKECFIYSNLTKEGQENGRACFHGLGGRTPDEAQMLHSKETEDDLTEVIPRYTVYCLVFPAEVSHKPCCISQSGKGQVEESQYPH